MQLKMCIRSTYSRGIDAQVTCKRLIKDERLSKEPSELCLTVRRDNNVNSEVPTNSKISARVHLYRSCGLRKF